MLTGTNAVPRIAPGDLSYLETPMLLARPYYLHNRSCDHRSGRRKLTVAQNVGRYIQVHLLTQERLLAQFPDKPLLGALVICWRVDGDAGALVKPMPLPKRLLPEVPKRALD